MIKVKFKLYLRQVKNLTILITCCQKCHFHILFYIAYEEGLERTGNGKNEE